MVKPDAHLDVIRLLRDNTALPVAAYHVSGEYAMTSCRRTAGWTSCRRHGGPDLLQEERGRSHPDLLREAGRAVD